MLIKIKKSRPVLYGRYFLNFESAPPEETVVTPYNKTIRNVAFSGVFFEAPEDDDNAPIAGEDEIPDGDLMAIANGGTPSGGGGKGGGSSEPDANNVPAGDDNAPIAGEDEIPDGDIMTIANGGTPGDGPATSDTDDFTGGGDDSPAPVSDGPATDGGEDFTDGADDGGGDAPATDGPATEDNSQDFTDGAEDGGDDGGGDAPDAPATDGGGDDFTSGAEDGSSSGGGGDDEGDSGDDGNGENDKPGVDYDSMRKYMLFNEYIDLSNSVDGFISKLEGITKDDVEENRVILKAVTDLREIRDLLADYIKMKFKTDTYFLARLFHQRMITAVQLVFRSIKTMQEMRPKEKHKAGKNHSDHSIKQ